MSLPRNGSALIKNITIYGFGPMENPTRVDTSSFVQKLLAFCCYNNIKFSFDGAGTMSPIAGRCPWMKVELEDINVHGQTVIVNIEDSQRCITELSSCFGIDMDSHLTKDERIQSENLRLLIENVLYFCFIRKIWVHHSDSFAKKGKLAVPDFMKNFVVGMIRKDIISTLNIQGNGDLTDTESDDMSANIYREIVRVLGNKKFLFSNDKPSLIDCVMCRFLDKIEESAETTAPQVLKVFQENPQLAAYGARIQSTFFPSQVEKRLVEEGTVSYIKAKAKATQMIFGALSVVVALVAIGGYFGFNYLKGAGYF